MDPASTQLDRLNQGLNLLQSVQLPFALIPVSLKVQTQTDINHVLIAYFLLPVQVPDRAQLFVCGHS
jgi:hypothetical protein